MKAQKKTPTTCFLVLFLSVLFIPFLQALDYDFSQPPAVIEGHREYQFSITSRERVHIENLPDHRKVFWLSTIHRREEGPVNFDAFIVTVRFMATSPGLIQFPAIPVKIGTEAFLIRLDDITAIPNPVPPENCHIQLLWNGQEEAPKELYLGQTIELIIKENLIKDRARSIPTNPSRQLEGVDWHVYTPKRGQRARDEDYLQPHTKRSFFGRRILSRHHLSYFTNEDRQYAQYTYHTRFTIGATKRLTGHCYFNAEIGEGERVALMKVDIPVKSVPPLPYETAIDTGLVGQWSIAGQLEPPVLEANKPFKIALGLVGHGNPTLLRDFDFSRPGFSSIQLEVIHQNKATNDRVSPTQKLSFSQELLPSGEIPTFPPLHLATFNPQAGNWELHEISEAITLTGLDATGTIITQLNPAIIRGPKFQRPILLNLPSWTFPLIGLAPFLPLLAGLLTRQLDQRDPELEKRKNEFSQLLERLHREGASDTLVDDDVLPALRRNLNLPTGSTAREVSSELAHAHPELAELLTQHSDSAFGAQKTKIDLKTLAGHLAKVTFLLICLSAPLRGATLEEANAAFLEKRYRAAAENYESLIAETPGHPDLHLNLAKARLNASQPAHAQAACHTALLLDPTHSQGRELMDQILQQLGQPTLPGTQLLALRPDQFLVIVTFLWLAAFFVFALFRLKQFPRWPAWIFLASALILTAVAFWRKDKAYAPDQYMVLAEELPREPEAGTPNWDFPALRQGQIVQANSFSETHAFIVTPDTSFWLPLDQLQQVW